MEQLNKNPEYGTAKELMASMVKTSQRPGEGNTEFIDKLSGPITDMGLMVSTVVDPEYDDRSLLIAEVGDPEGEQALAAISHSDVVGIENQDWHHEPWELSEEEGIWYGRGVCDTHGSGVSMLLAATDPEVRKSLEEANKRVSVIFTYDEEATSPEFSMRGARLAVGALGKEAVATAKYYIAGEPTEIDGQIVPMRGHKGRFLASFKVDVEHSGHVSEMVQNALMYGSSIVHEIGEYSRIMTYGSHEDEDAQIYNPPHSTVQVSAADIKQGDFSTTPSTARFSLDMRTLPFVHDLRVREMSDLIKRVINEEGVSVELEVLKVAPGSITPADSPIVKVAERITKSIARGFNGGDEGRIMRLQGGMEGITLGPGKLDFAHMPDEQIAINSIFKASELYKKLFINAAKL